MRAKEFVKSLNEMTAGATGTGSIGMVVGGLGAKQASKKLREKQQSYTNIITRGGTIKAKK